jgi:hypothetical protein
MDRWVSTFANRDAMARSYRLLLETKDADWTGWAVLNLAIIDRWSLSGLRYIKTKAWSD